MKMNKSSLIRLISSGLHCRRCAMRNLPCARNARNSTRRLSTTESYPNQLMEAISRRGLSLSSFFMKSCQSSLSFIIVTTAPKCSRSFGYPKAYAATECGVFAYGTSEALNQLRGIAKN
jgi:hypothetical protein